MENEVGRQVNSLKNVYLLSTHLPTSASLRSALINYIDEVVNSFWHTNAPTDVDEKFLKLVAYFGSLKSTKDMDIVLLDSIIEELRSASVAQSNLVTLAYSKTPKILWILLMFLSTILVGSFIFLGFESQLLATILITLVSGVTGLIVALIFDIDSPFKSGFWNITPDPFVELRKFIVKRSS